MPLILPQNFTPELSTTRIVIEGIIFVPTEQEQGTRLCKKISGCRFSIQPKGFDRIPLNRTCSHHHHHGHVSTVDANLKSFRQRTPSGKVRYLLSFLAVNHPSPVVPVLRRPYYCSEALQRAQCPGHHQKMNFHPLL